MADNEMVERVGLELRKRLALSPAHGEDIARAVIAAMREPDDAMLDAGFEASPHDVGGCTDQISEEEWRNCMCPDIYRAMIDAALTTPSP